MPWRISVDVGAALQNLNAMVIGSVGQFQTSLPPIECSQRLSSKLRRFMFGSRADPSGFRLAKSGRTMIRIVGTFRAVSGGSTVVYRIEWMPAALIAVAIAFAISIPIIALLIWLRYVPLEALAPLLVIIPWLRPPTYGYRSARRSGFKSSFFGSLTG